MIMGDGLDLMQVAAGAAAVLVADMAKKSWKSAREAMERIFKRGGAADEASVEQELRLLDTAHRRLNESKESERKDLSKRLEQELLIQLGAFLQKNPESAPELKEWADQSEQPEAVAGVQAVVRDNTGSQVLIAGRDVSTGNFTYGAPKGEK
ncbi:hypothetical protein ACH41E_27865 [Streptomyces sp. NPDC020412]|uniref:hypothetical protein n=1 Tax=Streptomyces sp. NPDC020412 TaxID=3365073 RepID=UPI0037B12D32